MQMQQPEQQQQFEQGNQEYGAYNAEYPGSYRSEQQQKIYPQQGKRLSGTTLGVLAIIISSIGFFLAIAGIVLSAITLKYGHAESMLAGVRGLLGSIGLLFICIAIFVITVIILAIRSSRGRRRVRIRHS